MMRVEKSGLRLRRNDSWTPPPTLELFRPLSKEYPIGKGFRLLPSVTEFRSAKSNTLA